MLFTDLKINEFVRFNENIKYLYFKLKEDFLWVDESLECVLEVRELDLNRRTVEMECVDGCGTHAKLDFTEQEFEEMASQLGEDVLKVSSMGEAFNPYKKKVCSEKYELTVEDNKLIIDKFLEAILT